MNLMIKDIPKKERPRERLINVGVNNLSNEELLSIVLKTGTKNKSVRELSMEILNNINDITKLNNLTLNKLLEIKGIGSTKASELLASIELGRRVFYNNINNKEKCSTAFEVFMSTKYLFINQKQECFYVLYLNNKNELLERKLLFMGTINKSIVHPREIFKHAYLNSASSIICIHNHPSGDINPSKEDILLTKSLYEIGKIQCIPVLDHIIVSNDDYYSFSDNLNILNL